MTEAVKLQPLSFPLTGLQLIEASAGTGKTYTITALYLRLLLGLSDVAGGKPLGPEQILVVTFTEAATEELRDRIRGRIAEARRMFARGKSADPLLAQLLGMYPEHDKALELLDMALRQIDEAAIFTIHGFCQRMLRQHAFESGGLFESELIQDESPWLRQALLDFWRNQLYRLPDQIAQDLLALWKTPDLLLAELRPWLHTSDLRLEPELPEFDLLAAYESQQASKDAFCQAWLGNDEDLAALVAASDVNKRSYTKKNVPTWLARISAWAEQGAGAIDKDTLIALNRFKQTALLDSAKQNPPQHALFSMLDELAESEVPLREWMLSRAHKEVAQALQQAKQLRRLLSFDDLLSGLDTALQADDQQLLASAIRRQFPVALIDEFQDTDPLQYRIFSHLYRQQDDAGLIMIGDPKQAIYAFRGADIYTYIGARRAVDQAYTLDTNWRSTTAMVNAVNQLFAFSDNPFMHAADIPFQAVNAAGKSDRTPFKLAGKVQPALQFWHSEQLLTRTDYRQHYAEATAQQIDTLLQQGEIGERPLEAGEIAILVRDRHEAQAVRDSLAQRQIPCVYLSNRDSVFNSVEALDLLRILQAVQEPTDERSLRAALASSLMALDVPTLDLLNRDEAAWEAAVIEFGEYRDGWLRLGVLPMLHRLLHTRQLAVQLLQQPGGERRLTDLLHLGELLQNASTQIDGIASLVRWFREQISSHLGEGDEQLLRLESERNLVKVITIHKSKGLEYPVVFLPFVSDFRAAKTGFYHEPEQHQAVWALDNNEDALAAADQERLAEELRLLYVALTRAVYCCYVGISEIKVGNVRSSQLSRSALGYLLAVDESELTGQLDALVASSAALEIQITPLPDSKREQPDLFALDDGPVSENQFAAKVFEGRVSRDWRLSSYSALSQHGSQHLPQAGIDLEVIDEQQEEAAAEVQTDIFSFPRGARAGTFLHSLFEELPFDDVASEESQQLLQEMLIQQGYCSEDDLTWLPVMQQMLADVLNADLDGAGLKLSQLTAEDKLVEMEFMLPVAGLDAEALNQLVMAEDSLSAQARPLHFDHVKGMLKGFIDLVFRVGERYYIADYKSNHLGDELTEYHSQALGQAMLEHRYDLQYQLYSLALHRLLQQRLPDYDPERHLGGVFYLFLRGMRAEQQSGVFFAKPSANLIQQMDQLFHGVS